MQIAEFIFQFSPAGKQTVSVMIRKNNSKKKNRSAMRTWGLMLKFIRFSLNAILTYQCLEAELLQAKR